MDCPSGGIVLDRGAFFSSSRGPESVAGGTLGSRLVHRTAVTLADRRSVFDSRLCMPRESGGY
jgi:hypothetical protein